MLMPTDIELDKEHSLVAVPNERIDGLNRVETDN